LNDVFIGPNVSSYEWSIRSQFDNINWTISQNNNWKIQCNYMRYFMFSWSLAMCCYFIAFQLVNLSTWLKWLQVKLGSKVQPLCATWHHLNSSLITHVEACIHHLPPCGNFLLDVDAKCHQLIVKIIVWWWLLLTKWMEYLTKWCWNEPQDIIDQPLSTWSLT
jgi:hypothetical protein